MKIIQHIIDFFKLLHVWMKDLRYLVGQEMKHWRDET